jgi:putative membrane protein
LASIPNGKKQRISSTIGKYIGYFNMPINLQSFMPNYAIFRNPLKWSIFLALLVHVSGAIGIAFFNRQFFVGFTALNLFLMFLLLLWNEAELNSKLLKAFLFAFFVGILTEMIGVNTGMLFGSYHYGSVFGEKIKGVPILIGLNWFCIVYASHQIALSLSIKFKWFITSLTTSIIATIFDWIMEPVALKLGFWQWQDNQIPIFNYMSWFGVSFLVALFFSWLGIKKTNRFALYLLLIQVAFFVFLNLFLS